MARVKPKTTLSIEEQLREVIDTIPAYVWSLTPDAELHFANRRVLDYIGLTGEVTDWRRSVHPEDLAQFVSDRRAAFASGQPLEREVRIRRADGQYRWWLVRYVPQHNKSGEIVQWYGAGIDIEDRKRAEQLQSDLAHVNRVSMLGEMAASLAHEIKQPLAAAITSANTCIEWLTHEPPDLDRARAAATRIDKYGNRATEIINRIRTLYSKSPPQRELVDVNGIVDEILTLLRGEATRYSVVMRTELAAQLPKIMADPVQLQQVFMNLMLNAIEAMQESGGEFTVKSQLRDGQLEFSISDTGVGLPMEKVDEIFSAFCTTKPQGSGMGLSISRSIVESHGGRLWATANDGRGATFHFTLPTEVMEPRPVVT